MKTSISRIGRPVVFALLLCIAFPGVGQDTADRYGDNHHWVGTWSTSAQEVEHQLVPEGFDQLDDVTIRQLVRVSIGGKRLRIRLSNVFADWRDDVKISAVSVARSAGGHAVAPGTARPVTFHGSPSVTVPYGVLMVSDPVEFELAPGSDLVVTLHVDDATKKLTGHRSARGEVVHLQRGRAVSAADLPESLPSTCWYYLCGVDVLAPSSSAAVVCLGDSITDGKGSTPGANRRWPDYLARRLLDEDGGAGVGVLNHGIGGNALRRGGIGQTALQRLERDVLAQPGARWLILFEGINDLGGGNTTAAELRVACEQVVARARDRGFRVYGATILPCGESFYASPALEAQRQEINRWIRTGGVFDAVLDWDAAVRDPEDPSRLLPAADCGDHLHLSDEGYRMLADAVNLDLFTR